MLKEDNQWKKGIQEYQDSMRSDPPKEAGKLSVRDMVRQRKMVKQLFKGNLMDPESIDRIKQDIVKNSIQISNFGIRNKVWKPDKIRKNAKKKKE